MQPQGEGVEDGGERGVVLAEHLAHGRENALDVAPVGGAGRIGHGQDVLQRVADLARAVRFGACAQEAHGRPCEPQTDHRHEDQRRHDRFLVAVREFAHAVHRSRRTGVDRLVLEVPHHVVGKGRRGLVAPCAILLERLHHDPVEIAPQ